VTNQKPKRQYRIRNWQHYNKALVKRGSLTLWLDQHSLNAWLSTTRGERGRPRLYTDAAILCALLMRETYHLSLRSTQGLVASILHLMRLDLPSAHYSTLSRRVRSLSLSLTTSSQQIKHLVIDSSGLKVYGEGELQIRTHGKQKRRTWLKLHLAMDAATHQLTAASLTDKDVLDRNALSGLLDQTTSEIERVCADGAYDFEQCYRAIKQKEAVALIPPREDAVVRGRSPFEQRDEDVREIQSKGRKEWKKESTYHRRSLVECAFFRLKTIFSDRLRSRRTETQTTEAMTRCRAMNRMTSLGMPESSAI
jgi:transposase